MAVLKLIRGGAVGQILPISGDRVVLGRHPTCQIVLDNVAVSRHHAQILESHGTYFLEDLRSRNGTQLNSESIRGRVELKDGDQIKLCDYVFQFLVASKASTQLPRPSVTRLQEQHRTRETIDNVEDLPIEGDERLNAPPLDGSSIISSLEPESIQTIRLHVRPEVKLRAILDISQILARALQVDTVLPLILDGLFKIFPQAEWGFVLLKDPVTQRSSVRSSKSRRADEDDRFPFSQTIVEQAMSSGKALLSADAQRDARFNTSDSLQGLQIRSVMCSPMLDSSSHPLGVIQISTRDLSQQFTSDDLELLVSVTTQCARALEHATLHEQLLTQRAVEQELEFATQVQLGFLPSEAPQLPGYEFDDYYEPAHRVSGDYFDYVRLPNGNLAVTVGDVAGKGVPAALLMARLHASARYHLLSATSAAEALSSLNSEISTSGLGFRFITLVMVVINPKTQQIHIANAGHLPPLLRSRRGVIGPLGLKDSGMPLGVLQQQNYRETVIPLEPEDTLLMFTDGLTEAMNDQEQIYGQARLLELLKSAPQPVEELVPYIVDDVENFVSERSQRDDLCIVAVRRVE